MLQTRGQYIYRWHGITMLWITKVVTKHWSHAPLVQDAAMDDLAVHIAPDLSSSCDHAGSAPTHTPSQ